jgi:hypothetical protein
MGQSRLRMLKRARTARFKHAPVMIQRAPREIPESGVRYTPLLGCNAQPHVMFCRAKLTSPRRKPELAASHPIEATMGLPNPVYSARARIFSAATILSLAVATLVVGAALPATADTTPTDATTPATVTADVLPTAQIDGVAWSQPVRRRERTTFRAPTCSPTT